VNTPLRLLQLSLPVTAAAAAAIMTGKFQSHHI